MEVNNLRDAFERGRPVYVFVCVFAWPAWICTVAHPLRGALIMCGSVLWASPVGEDPLAERGYDLDSVAGVLKLYFRDLENPLFPIDSTSQLLEHARKWVWKCVCEMTCQMSIQQKLIFLSSPFFRNKERGRESSSAQNGHLFLPWACHHCHEISLCIPSSVSISTQPSSFRMCIYKQNHEPETKKFHSGKRKEQIFCFFTGFMFRQSQMCTTNSFFMGASSIASKTDTVWWLDLTFLHKTTGLVTFSF